MLALERVLLLKAENLYDWDGKDVVLHLGGEVAGSMTYRGKLKAGASSVLQLDMNSGQVFRVQQELIVAATLMPDAEQEQVKVMGFKPPCEERMYED